MRAKIFAEYFGSALLLLVVTGSGIMGESLAGGNVALVLLVNSLATGAGLYVLIESLNPISGAHFNPLVSLMETIGGRLTPSQLASYAGAQLGGAISGVWLSHLLFRLPVFQVSSKERFAANLWLSELLATFCLLCVVGLLGRRDSKSISACVALYVSAAYWFTSSTSFANPAATLARLFTNTFCGISPSGVLPFLAAQLAGALLAFWLLGEVQGASREKS